MARAKHLSSPALSPLTLPGSAAYGGQHLLEQLLPVDLVDQVNPEAGLVAFDELVQVFEILQRIDRDSLFPEM